ncbi:Ig-like domain repeat protein [Pseudomonas koreensis]|uniref:Ig-like domain-containing protein n=1 Tax=Pseudomonas koreensis TaxID=198620 RepID=UPI00123C0AB5|nr:Ig-like domain-containing protein [Pseudomonas koreensis]KAA8736964.1 Ig-like domain repeat protein [Pseudomonas koreensis]
MLIQPPRLPAPKSLRQLEIPDRTQPALEGGVWGINIAAAQLLAPDKGLKVYCPPWDRMGLGDHIELLLDGIQVDQTTLVKPGDVGERVTLYVPPQRFVTGTYTLQYRVKVFEQTPEISLPPVDIFVKLERPGGKDENGSIPGHSELYMYIDPRIINDGVDKETAETGLDIIIKAKPGSSSLLPYPNMAVGDRCKLTWGGWFVYSPRVTQDHIDNPQGHPLVIHVDKATILAAGDTDSLAVAFEVHDIVDNRSEDWCAAVGIAVDTGNTRLSPPMVKEAFNSVVDMDKLGDAPLTLQVLVDAPDFRIGDVIIGLGKGTTLDGEPISVEVRGEPLISVGNIYELALPSADIRLLAKTQAVFSYRVERSGSDDRASKGRFVSIIGATRRLLAPIAVDAQQGALDPDRVYTTAVIPFDPMMQVGMVIILRWVGTRQDFGVYDPELNWHTLSKGDIDDKEPIPIIVEGKHLKAIEGGTLDLFYVLMAEGSDGGIIQRESLHHALLRVGEPLLELVAPIVLGEAGGTLEPDDLPGGSSKLTAPAAAEPTKAGDKVTYTWRGSKTGKTSDSVPINSLNAGKAIDFTLNPTFVQTHIEPNRGGTVDAMYEILRVAAGSTPERVSYSRTLNFTVGEAVLLTRPKVQQAEADGTTLQPIKAVEALTVNIDSQDLLFSDLLSVTWTGAPGTAAGGSHTTPARPISETTLTIELPVTVLAFNLGKTVTVEYTVTRNGVPRTSLPLLLNVGTLPDSSLILPVIMDADDDGEGQEFNVGNLTSNATYRMGVWPLIATGQYVWLRLKGTNADGSDYNLQIHTAPGSMVSDKWLEQGYYERSIAFAGLRNLKDGSPLTMEFKAAFGKSTDESEAVPFPVRTYTIKAFEDVRPEITESKDSKGNEIAKGGFTVDTQIKLSGAGAKGQKVQIKDGTTVKGEATVNLTTGLWELTLTGLSVAAHSFTAIALYGSGQVSAAWTLTVTASNPPTITKAIDSKGNEIAKGGFTVDTQITLSGAGAKGQKVQIKDGTTVKGEATVNLTTGLWELTLTGLSVAAHSFTAIALYGSGQVSAAWTLTVTASNPPTITKAIDSKGNEIAKGGFTVDTQITLSGAGAKGQKVQIKDGTTVKGEATVNLTTGLWELTLTGLSVAAHSFTAIALYGSGQVSAAWTLTVTANTALTITSVKDQSNWNIPDNGHTVHTSVTLTGSAPDGQKVEVFLGAISKGIAEAGPDRTWTRTVSGLSLDVLHTLKAVGQYANNPTSNLWRLTALNGVRPAITAAHDSNGQPISNGGSTPDTRIRLTGTANTFLEVEIYDGATSTGKKARADDKGIWTVELTGLTTTTHLFKAKALYGSGTESGEWIVNVVDLVDLVENFDSYPREKWVTNPGETLEGTHTKLTVFTDIGREFRWVQVTESRTLWMQISSQITPAAFGYAVALKQGNAKSATIKGEFQSLRRHRIQIEFLQSNDVVSSILFFEGVSLERFERDVAPQNGQAFNAIKFVMTILEGESAMDMFLIYEIAYRS